MWICFNPIYLNVHVIWNVHIVKLGQNFGGIFGKKQDVISVKIPDSEVKAGVASETEIKKI